MTSVAQSGLVVVAGSPPSAEVGVEQETLIGWMHMFANIGVDEGLIGDAGKVSSIPPIFRAIEKIEDEIAEGIGSERA